MRPIPKRLLIHTAELKTVGINNTWQDEKITDMTKLKKIRIEPCSRLGHSQRQPTSIIVGCSFL